MLCFFSVLMACVFWGERSGASPRTLTSIEALMERYQRSSQISDRVEILQAMGSMGWKALPAKGLLLRSVEDPAWEIRRESLRVLGGLGSPVAAASLPSVQKRCLDARGEVRVAAAEALGRLSLSSLLEQTIPWLNGMLKDPLPSVRMAALGALRQLGEAAKEAMPSILQTLRDKEEEVQQEALRALAQMGKTAVTPALPDVTRLLQHKSWLTRSLAAYVLERWGSDASVVVGLLADALADPEMAVRLAVAKALAAQGQSSMALLQKGLQHTSPQARRAAVFGLRLLLPSAQAVQGLASALRDKDPETLESAIIALAEAKEAATPAVSALIPFLDEARPALRQAGIWALSQIGAGAVPALVAAASAPSWWKRLAAFDALGSLGALAAPAAPALLQSLHHPQWKVRRDAGVTIPRIGRALLQHWEKKEAIRELTRALHDTQWRVRYGAITALGWFGHDAAAALPALQKQRNDPEKLIRVAAEEAIRAIFPPSPPARR
jgi:HEAT repeat protein